MQIKKSKLIKTALFGVIVISGVITFVLMFNDNQLSDNFKTSKISAYSKLGYSVEQLLDTNNPDTLLKYAAVFRREFIGSETILADDTLLALPITRFKYELNDKVSGSVNLLDPDRFERSGRDIMRLCHGEIAKLSGTNAEQLISFYKH
jgi:hypothetical protein